MLVKELSAQIKLVHGGICRQFRFGVAFNACSQKDKIIEALDKLEAGGSTAGAAGITRPMRLPKQIFYPKGIIA